MALDLSAIPAFVGRILGPNADYPQGGSVDESFDGANDGTPYLASRANDLLGLLQSILLRAGISPSGVADTAEASQYLDGLSAIQNADVNFFVNPEMRISQEYGGAPVAVTGVPVVYTLDQVYAAGVTAGTITHTAITSGGVSGVEAAAEAVDVGVNTGAVLMGFAVEMAKNSRLNNTDIAFSFTADISANDDVDYDVFYADDSALTNSVLIGSGTIAMTTGYKTYSGVLTPATPLGTNVGVFVQLKKAAGAGDRTYTLTRFKTQQGKRATPVQSPGVDGGLAACRRYYKSEFWGEFNSIGIFAWMAATSNNVDCFISGQTVLRAPPTITTVGSVGGYQVRGLSGAVIPAVAAATSVGYGRGTVHLTFVDTTFGAGVSLTLVPSAGSSLAYQLDSRL
jgi:hypothetical protein